MHMLGKRMAKLMEIECKIRVSSTFHFSVLIVKLNHTSYTEFLFFHYAIIC
jgi:hypothetical protein